MAKVDTLIRQIEADARATARHTGRTVHSPHVPPVLLTQLQSGGRMIVPFGDPYGEQELRLLCKDHEDVVTDRAILPVAFVPLTRGDGV